VPPHWLIAKVGKFAAQLLYQRHLVEPEQIESFLSISAYQPASPFDFPEMPQAIARIQTAYNLRETIAIWGDFDADGITATAVLWEGLGQFFDQGDRLFFHIPDRLKESHGISTRGIDELRSHCQQSGTSLDLIISCDTGSTSLEALTYAQSLGIDVIVTDHHTLPDLRPPVFAIINPRYLHSEHPLFHLSGVAVAYKLMEALYASLPHIPQQPLENLLDLVAIGLVADLVRLTGDCRYLAQKGIEVLKLKQRLGVRMLLEQCKSNGDRPIDISFGIAPRINAVSRIWGDVRKCVDLLTTQDQKLCRSLIAQTEIANTQRKALQKKLFKQVQSKINQIDLSTTGIIVLADPDWSVGILGLVAGQVVAEYGRPTILCNVEDGIAKGSARSLEGINFYDLLKDQEHLLISFGGHPLAGGLSFRFDNLQVLTEAIDQKFWSQYGKLQNKEIVIDLELKIADLTRELFNEFAKLEPYGMGNPYPKLLIRDCRFLEVSHKNIRNYKKEKVEYIKTEFILSDRDDHQIRGDWWGHYSYEIPDTICDVVVELVSNANSKSYNVRLIDIHHQSSPLTSEPLPITSVKYLTNPHSQPIDSAIAWQTLVGIAKYLSRTDKKIKRSQLVNKLGIDVQNVLQIGFDDLKEYGYIVEIIAEPSNEDEIRINGTNANNSGSPQLHTQRFIQAVNELAFQQSFTEVRNQSR
jgi:single-stranded-DNA-specific exonuclease